MRPSICDLRAEPTATGVLLTWTVADPAALAYVLVHVHVQRGKPPRTRTLPAYARSARISLPLVPPADGADGYLAEVRPVTRGGCAAIIAPCLPLTDPN